MGGRGLLWVVMVGGFKPSLLRLGAIRQILCSWMIYTGSNDEG
jgi:hypothetical protein